MEGQKTKKWYALLGVIAVFAAGMALTPISGGDTDSVFADWIRSEYGPFLQELPPVPYERVLGFKPTKEQVELGRLLFNDTILSRNNDVSCATCHLTNHGFTNSMPLPFGALGQGGPTGDTVGRAFGLGELSDKRNCGDDGMGYLCDRPFFRNTPSTIDVAYRANSRTDEGLLLDGRFGRLAFQVLLPIGTAEELCGTNPVPSNKEENPFLKGGPFFSQGILVNHTHVTDPYTGATLPFFNSPPEVIHGIPLRRNDGRLSIPNFNECLAIALAKLNGVPEYRRLFRQAFQADEITDRVLGMAMAAFIATHVSKDTAFDRFVRGENSLSAGQMRGLVSFLSQPNEIVEIGLDNRVVGVGCVNCHSPPFFGGAGFGSLGVISDPRSIRSRPQVLFEQRSVSLDFPNQRGRIPRCHIAGVTARADGSYAPDIGRAEVTSREEDCFQFRIPPLRNVIERFPFFHHGTERALGYNLNSLEERSLQALRNVILYHLRGPQYIRLKNRLDVENKYFDKFFQYDEFIDPHRVDFFGTEGPLERSSVLIEEALLEDILSFVAYGLWDEKAVKRGDLNNRVSHPKKVPSGFHPSITRDHGTQLELPPAFRQ